MKRKLLLSSLLAVTLLLALVAPALGANPTVTITVNAATVSITNSKDTWNITDLVGAVNADDIVYFSADGTKDDDWSTITNTGNVAVDVEIHGTDLTQELGAYNWTLGAATGANQYSLYATNDTSAPNYDTEVKSSAYDDICTGLAPLGTCKWSMKFTAPSTFDENDDGAAKKATVTLVASQS